MFVIKCAQMEDKMWQWSQQRGKIPKGFLLLPRFSLHISPSHASPLFSIPSCIRSSGYPLSICWSACKDKKTNGPRCGSISAKRKGWLYSKAWVKKQAGVSFNKFWRFYNCASFLRVLLFEVMKFQVKMEALVQITACRLSGLYERCTVLLQRA